jgi:hypothetical protein
MERPGELVSTDERGLSGLRKFFGTALIVCGLVAAIWTIMQVMGVLAAEDDFTLLDRLIPGSRIERTILVSTGERFELPASFFTMGAYGIMIGALSIMATIANAMIRGGAALLQLDVSKQFERLRRELVGR